jgi:hypothetical protein
MTPTPVALGLTLCDYVIVEERTKKISTIGSFSSLKVRQFPTIPQPFCVLATLTDSVGDGIMDLVITEIEGNKETYAFRQPAHFSDRLAETKVLFRIKNCSFPKAGWYEFALLADSEFITQRRLLVHLEDELP